MKTNIGKKIRNLRLEKNMTMKDVAAELQVSRSTYRDWEYGRKLPADTLSRIAEVFKVSLDELMGKEVTEAQIVPKVIQLIEEGLRLLKRSQL